MRTAMIAALSCALLCGPLVASSAHALQCEKGQASLKLDSRGVLTNGREEGYTATVRGNPGLDYADIPEVSNVSSLNIYFTADSIPTVALPYTHKASPERPCLYFSDRTLETESGVEVEVLAGGGARTPHICFATTTTRDAAFALDIYVSPARVLKITNPRIYVQGKRKSDGTSFTLFDTNNACKE